MKTSFHCSADLANLEPVRQFIRNTAQPVCTDDDCLYDLELAVDEVVTNIIVHGYHGAPGDIDIEMQARAGELMVVIKDKAPLFDPHSAPKPNLDLPLEKRKPGGLGIVLVSCLMDGMIYTPGSVYGNELTLVKYCPGNGHTPHNGGGSHTERAAHENHAAG